jgi:arsenate reductase (thioredoxin)
VLQKLKVLILCTGNSARSQMAEGFWRHYGGDRWEAVSAGVEPKGVNPTAIQVMAEVGIDISKHRSKSVTEFLGRPFDLVITVCGKPAEACPSFPGAARQVHWPIEDPPKVPGTDPEKLQVWRRARDEIGARIGEYLGRT